jgi:DMSO/TMAO reductase YedYZ molybdopterin-dependent catalytic subunit
MYYTAGMKRWLKLRLSAPLEGGPSSPPVHPGRRRVVAAIATLPWTSDVFARAAETRDAQDGSDLIALPGTRPLIKRTFRPPNFETPLTELREAFTASDAFFVRYHLAVIPEVDARSWRLRIGGASAQKPVELSLQDLKRRFTPVSVAAINQCAGLRRGLFTPRVPGVQWEHGAVGNAVWTGIRLRDVLDHAGLRADATEVVFNGSDFGVLPATPDFMKSLPVDQARNDSTLIAFEMNGKPLPRWHGAPARLVVPGWAATYWVKHLSEVRIEPHAFDGFWMKSAYRVPANKFPTVHYASQETPETWPVTNLLINSLITSHRDGDRLPRGKPVHLGGWAWDGGSGVTSVGVSVNGGNPQDASLGKDLGRFAWRAFEFPLDTTTPGRITVLVRAMGRDGARQPDSLTPNPSGYYHNAVQRVELEVVA